jgi:hypothetical protein
MIPCGLPPDDLKKNGAMLSRLLLAKLPLEPTPETFTNHLRNYGSKNRRLARVRKRTRAS